VDALWARRSLRAQLLLAFVLIDIVAVLIAGGFAILRARTQARIEMAASMRLAEVLVGDTVNLLHQEIPAQQFLAALPPQLRSIRHVRIAVKDAGGFPIVATPPSTGKSGGSSDSAPDWFVALVAPPKEFSELPVIVDGRTVGKVEFIGEPADEIAEFWENTAAAGSALVLLNVVMIGIMYVLFGRVLKPLSVLATGLSDLERQSYSVRLSRPPTRELATIANHFNALAFALETARTENMQLNRRLLAAQDDERRHTALELHDEVGPCLFGLKASATSIVGSIGDLPEKARQSMSERSGEILAIVEHLQAINRSMLDRLRPMAIGHVPLQALLEKLLGDRVRQHRPISFTFKAIGLQSSYGESIDLTIYRCMQESLTNVVRHAQPKRVTVELSHAGARLELTVRDDGRGINPSMSAGYGIRGMQERVKGLGGSHALESQTGHGTCVRIIIPIAETLNALVESDGPRSEKA
jgi:two-component system, NarL family, sensor histidine kinase UhpB